ncbi:hypothetical protein ACF09Z_37535 [Streptomyces erythrochromogenes]|uniref:hypothetical protein n=1 Tax=Streptomyces erythrochromogenes TaxID=285574 RepID=UPI0036FCAABE
MTRMRAEAGRRQCAVQERGVEGRRAGGAFRRAQVGPAGALDAVDAEAGEAGGDCLVAEFGAGAEAAAAVVGPGRRTSATSPGP